MSLNAHILAYKLKWYLIKRPSYSKQKSITPKTIVT